MNRMLLINLKKTYSLYVVSLYKGHVPYHANSTACMLLWSFRFIPTAATVGSDAAQRIQCLQFRVTWLSAL